jgi:hypothetical protein
MNAHIVTTKEDLSSAKDAGYEEIVIVGELADQVKRGKKIALAGAVVLGILTVTLAATPFTGGLSMFAAAPIAVMTGTEVTAIIAVSMVGLSLLVAIFKDYEEIEYANGRLTLRKKQKQ